MDGGGFCMDGGGFFVVVVEEQWWQFFPLPDLDFVWMVIGCVCP